MPSWGMRNTNLSNYTNERIASNFKKKMEEIKDLLEEFVDWAKDCGEDAWYIFDNTEEAIERFLKQRE